VGFITSRGSCVFGAGPATVFSPLLALWSDPLPNAQVGVPYLFTLTARGGVPPYTFAVVTGVLPAGLTLNAATGLISGTPTTAVTLDAVTFSVTDSAA
jgi:hypothetical protein